MAIYLPCRKDIDSPELARLFFEHVLCQHGLPDNIITDRGGQFYSQFWKQVCSHLSVDHRLSTAFHPQTDGQTECQNQTMEQYLRAYTNYEQNDWVQLLPLAQFAYNNAVHASTRFTPFYANYGYNPTLQFKRPKAKDGTTGGTEVRAEQEADAFVDRLHETHEQLREHILEAQRWQTKYAKGKAIEFKIGEKVWLSTRHIKTQRESKKLDYK